MRKEFNILIFILLIVAFVACNNDETCRKVRYVTMNVSFFNDTINQKTGDTVQIALTFKHITSYGINSDLIDVDSIISTTNKSTVQLPLNQFDTKSKFVIKCDANTDTLNIYYTNKYQYLSLECGTLRVEHLDSVLLTNKYFYKVKIENPEVNVTTTNSNVKNISIHHFVH
jgi:hypothetical protein